MRWGGIEWSPCSESSSTHLVALRNLPPTSNSTFSSAVIVFWSILNYNYMRHIHLEPKAYFRRDRGQTNWVYRQN